MHTRWSILFEEKISEALMQASEHLCGGGAADYPMYREHVGRINGLREALRMAEEVDTKITGG